LPSTTESKIQQSLSKDNLPLAVYLEIAAHLSQIEGVSVSLLPQQSQVFDYYQSQVGGLLLEYSSSLDDSALALLQEILIYYDLR